MTGRQSQPASTTRRAATGSSRRSSGGKVALPHPDVIANRFKEAEFATRVWFA